MNRGLARGLNLALAATLLAGCGQVADRGPDPAPSPETTAQVERVRLELVAQLDAARTDAAVKADRIATLTAEVERLRAVEGAGRASRGVRRGSVGSGAGLATGDVWWRLALCESGGRNVDTGNGFSGYFQFTDATWRSIAGNGRAVDYDYATQRAAAIRLQARSGWGQWPVCSRNVGVV